MPKLLTRIDHMTVHPDDMGVSTVSVWFTAGRTQREKVTFTPFDVFDYQLFCAKVLETTGHPFISPEVEDARDAWDAETVWRRVVSRALESASVDDHSRTHWKPLID